MSKQEQAQVRAAILRRRKATGLRIRKAREAKGMSVGELAAKSGLTQDGIRKLEHGHRSPRYGTAWRLSGVLGVPAEKLMGEGL